ncbi:MAG: hypothetical protein WCP70_07400 [Methanothrix sp.]
MNIFSFRQASQASLFLDGPILADPQEQNSVDNPLNSEVKILLADAGISQSDVPGQHIAPL